MESSTDFLLSAEGLKKAYAGKMALDGVNLRLAAGERVALLGINGAGKTSCLDLLAGAASLDAGKVLLGASLLRPHQSARTAYLPQQLPLYPHLTVEQQLSFVCGLLEDGAAAVVERVQRYLRLCRLERLRHRLITHLSAGQRQLLGFAQTLAVEADVLLLDEPMTALDPLQRELLADLLRDFAEAGGAVLLSSHGLAEMQSLCDRALVLHQGIIRGEYRLREADPLTASQDECTLILRLRDDPGNAVVEELPGVLHSRLLSAGRYRLRLREPGQVPLLASRLTPWGLQELRPESDSLESFFSRLLAG